jgi:hypothetical protein
MRQLEHVVLYEDYVQAGFRFDWGIPGTHWEFGGIPGTHYFGGIPGTHYLITVFSLFVTCVVLACTGAIPETEMRHTASSAVFCQ